MTTALSQIRPSQNPEDVARRHRNYMEAREPLTRAMVALVSLARPTFCLVLHSDGSSTNMLPHDDGMTPEMRQQMQWLKDQDAALARSYGFETTPEARLESMLFPEPSTTYLPIKPTPRPS